jgi:adhesin/invasin
MALTGLLLPAGASAAGAVQRDFFATGAEQQFVVPAGITEIAVFAAGGKGGYGAVDGGAVNPGGFGAQVSGSLTVTPGDVIYVEVGGNGGLPGGGFNGGGDGGTPGGGGFGGGGGGASDVRLCSRTAATCTSSGDTLGSRLLVAAGGGGGGAIESGVAGGAGGGANEPGASTGGDRGTAGGGGAGTSIAGGAGGGGSAPGQPGDAGQGGNAADGGFRDGGGGGGGLYGGGAGGNVDGFYGGGGGGGSSLVPLAGATLPDGSGVPRVRISYTPGPAANVALDVTPSSIVADNEDTTTATATVTDSNGVGVAGENVKFTTDAGNLVTSTTDHGDGTYTATITSTATTRSVTVTATDITPATDPSNTDTFEQTPGPVQYVTVTASPSSIVADGTTTTVATATLTDAPGNPIPGKTVTFSTDASNPQVGPVTDNGDGTYSATLQSTTVARGVTVTAAHPGSGEFGSGSFTQTPGPATAVALSATPNPIAADGSSTTTATATVTDANANPVPGDALSFQTNAGNAIGPVTDNGDGTYSATITSTTVARSVTARATDSSAVSQPTNTTVFGQISGAVNDVSVIASPAPIVADGTSTTTATATVRDEHGNGVSGKDVEFGTNAGNAQIGAVTDNGDGTYSAVLKSTTAARGVIVTATETDSGEQGTTAFTQTAGPATGVHVFLAPNSIVADGSSATTATATVTDANGNRVPDDSVSFQTNAGNNIGSVTDNGDGTYSATITSTSAARSVAVKATDSSPAGHPSDTATLTQRAGAATSVSVALAPASVAANGTSTSTATATVSDANGNRVSGHTVTIATNGGNTVSAVTPGGNGTYAATITSTTTVGPVTVTATDTTPAPDLTATATLTQTAGASSSVAVSIAPGTLPADDSSTATITATLTDANGHALAGQPVSFSSSDSHQGIGAVTDNGDGTYAATLTASRTAGTATITAKAGAQTGSTTLTQNDVTSPTAALGVPGDGSMFVKGQIVKAAYDCQDDAGGSGIASCTGTTAAGADVDTSTVGPHQFTVTATDNAGNATTRTATYTVIGIPVVEVGNPALALRGGKITVKRGLGKVSATCTGPAGQKCSGKLSARALVAKKVRGRNVVKRVTVASGKFSLATGAKRTLTIKVNRAGRNLLKGGALTAVLTATDKKANPKSVTSLITLR